MRWKRDYHGLEHDLDCTSYQKRPNRYGLLLPIVEQRNGAVRFHIRFFRSIAALAVLFGEGDGGDGNWIIFQKNHGILGHDRKQNNECDTAQYDPAPYFRSPSLGSIPPSF